MNPIIIISAYNPPVLFKSLINQINIIISILIIIANYIEYKGKLFSALGFQRKKFTVKNILVFAPLAAVGLFAFYFFALVPGITKLT